MSNTPWADRLIKIFRNDSFGFKFIKVPKNKLLYNVFGNVKDRIDPKFDVFSVIVVSCNACGCKFLLHTGRATFDFIMHNHRGHKIYEHFWGAHGFEVDFSGIYDNISFEYVDKSKSFKGMIYKFNLVVNKYLLNDVSVVICNNQYKRFDKRLYMIM